MKITFRNETFSPDDQNFFEFLKVAIVNRVYHRMDCMRMPNGEDTTNSRIIVEFNKIRLAFDVKKFDHTKSSVTQYFNYCHREERLFRLKLSFLLKYGSLENYTLDTSLVDFNSKKYFETIEYKSQKFNNNSTPIIYTGMSQ